MKNVMLVFLGQKTVTPAVINFVNYVGIKELSAGNLY